MKRIRVNGTELAVRDEGAGDPVLLLHGFPDDHRVWDAQVPALVQAGYRVIAPDLRGCGQSAMPDGVQAYRLPVLVEDVAELIGALGLERVRLVAHDWGAVIGWHLCIAHPHLVERFAALSVGHPTAYATAPLAQKLKGYYVLLFQLRGIAEALIRAGNWRALRRMAASPAQEAQWTGDLARAGRLTAALNYYRANLSLLRPQGAALAAMPVMGVWSDGDRFLCREQMTGSARFTAGGFRYEELSGVGHWMTIEAPERLNALLLDFLHEGR